MDLETFKQEKNKLSKALEKHSRAMLVDAFKEFFDANPNVQSVQWTQYTPYFNDGDVCEFSRHDFNYAGDFADSLKKDAYPESDTDEDSEDSAYYSDYSFKDKSDLAKSTSKLEKALEGTDDVFLAAFGDGVQVTAKRSGFTVEDYEHD